MYPDIDCEIFDHPTPMTLALSVLVIIEMLNALNRYLPVYLASPVPVSMLPLLTGEKRGVTGTTERSSVPPASASPVLRARERGFECRDEALRGDAAGMEVVLVHPPRHGFLV